MSNENQDLLDLCRLNAMEENIKDHPDSDRDNTMKPIDYKKRVLVTKLLNRPCPIAGDAMEKQYKENTVDGIYPFTDALPEKIDEAGP